ncbi:DoxX family protein [Solimonas sp. K1W22B-7]|uniref:DoxX family protein n=1 Tax=Solimonas sp. K1W22B-7 TaxID=2303331 RepID=UPI000E331CE8|nr:DoxX family protein [Solimonas sp. K1W22B-7]AXQ31461.1 DoxX family protein [Solimonas sp. K1W22B-7]
MSTHASTSTRNLVAPSSRNRIQESSVNTLKSVSELAGRILLSAIFLISGLGKIGAYAGTAAYMSSLGVPAALLPAVVATEVLGAVAIIVGWQTRVTAFLLAGFTLLTGLVFHSHFADPMQSIMFLKNVAIAGGFLLLVASGAGPLSVDRRYSK